MRNVTVRPAGGNRIRPRGVSCGMPKLPRHLPLPDRSVLFLLTAVAAVIVAACGGAPSRSPSVGVPSGGPSGGPIPSTVPSPTTTGEIEHRTGSTDVILRLQEAGGFVPIEVNASAAPIFTLYGNGVIVFQRPIQVFPEPDAAGIVRPAPWRTAKLDESQIQELLEFALGAGGLGAARESYHADGIADAPDTIFTVRAGGVDKTVTVNALFELPQPGPDAAIRRAMLQLSSRLRDVDRGGSIPSDVYVAERYRAILVEREAQPGLVVTPWPWPALTLKDFTRPPDDGSGALRIPHRVLSTDEIAALKVPNVEGGFQGLTLKAPDGRIYSFILRPLLVDEPE